MDLFGLPWHPLIVHAAVVLVPLGALGALAALTWRRARRRYGLLTEVVLVSGAIAAVAARLSGEQLLTSLGGAVSPAIALHHAWGLVAPIPVAVLAMVFPVLLWAAPRQARAPWVAVVLRVSQVLTAAAALAAVALIAVVGHLGAVAVWGR